MEFAFIGVVWLLLIVLALITALSWTARTARRIRRWWYETTPQTRYFVETAVNPMPKGGGYDAAIKIVFENSV